MTLTFDLLTLKEVSESRVTWATSMPILVFLGLSVLDLGQMYATNRQTSDGTVWYGIVEFNVTLDTVWVISETGDGYVRQRHRLMLPGRRHNNGSQVYALPDGARAFGRDRRTKRVTALLHV